MVIGRSITEVIAELMHDALSTLRVLGNSYLKYSILVVICTLKVCIILRDHARAFLFLISKLRASAHGMICLLLFDCFNLLFFRLL